ncbi:hypothetical protein NQ318_000686 [Aromia moschata]|uniref:Chitinase n=1 Tax=Aromia moschata TaxID=1265417 RepID=A0AAV8XH31_9CUCU|nr:hypothetical protein NQ318_000686 [Aromia moschata]
MFSPKESDYSAREWVKQGAPKEKLMIGMPTYGRSFELVNVTQKMDWSRPRLSPSLASAFPGLNHYGFLCLGQKRAKFMLSPSTTKLVSERGSCKLPKKYQLAECRAAAQSYHATDFGIPAQWHFFATAHGKGPCDGVGAGTARPPYLGGKRRLRGGRPCVGPVGFGGAVPLGLLYCGLDDCCAVAVQARRPLQLEAGLPSHVAATTWLCCYLLVFVRGSVVHYSWKSSPTCWLLSQIAVTTWLCSWCLLFVVRGSVVHYSWMRCPTLGAISSCAVRR